MRTGTQNAGLIHNFEQLRPTDLTLDQSYVDPAELTPTYPIDPGWLNLRGQFAATGNLSISGAGRTINDIDITDHGTSVLANPSDPIQAKDNRLWNNIRVQLGGGGTTPINVALAIQFPGSGNFVYQYRDNLPNPGSYWFGSILIPSNGVFQLDVAAGSGSDTVGWTVGGFMSAEGVPLPLAPSLSLITTGV